MSAASLGFGVSDRHGGSFGSRRASFGAEFRIGGGQFRIRAEVSFGAPGGGEGMLRGSDPKLTQSRTRY